MKRVAILTTFDYPQTAYSLDIIAQMQLKMLRLNDYKPVFIATKGFKGKVEMYHKGSEYAKVEIREYSPVVKGNSVADYKDTEKFIADAEKLAGELELLLKDIDVVITHDLIYQADAVKHNLAARKVASKLSNLRWLHWVHSATPPAVLNEIMKRSDTPYMKLVEEPFPNSYIVFPNAYDIPRVARAFNVDEGLVKCVNHPIDLTADFDPTLEQLIFIKQILGADIVGTHPMRLDRGKQPEIVIKIFHALKQHGFSVRLLFADFHSTGGDKATYRQELKNLAADLEMTDSEITWLSEINPNWKTEAPRKVMMDLFSISNVYILPSKSETYSLTAQEAARFGNILMLNQDFPPLRSVYKDFPIYRKFSSNLALLNDVPQMSEGSTQTNYSPSEWGYWKDCAIHVASRLGSDTIAQQMSYIRRTKNLQTIFRQQFQPLIEK